MKRLFFVALGLMAFIIISSSEIRCMQKEQFAKQEKEFLDIFTASLHPQDKDERAERLIISIEERRRCDLSTLKALVHDYKDLRKKINSEGVSHEERNNWHNALQVFKAFVRHNKQSNEALKELIDNMLKIELTPGLQDDDLFISNLQPSLSAVPHNIPQEKIPDYIVINGMQFRPADSIDYYNELNQLSEKIKLSAHELEQKKSRKNEIMGQIYQEWDHHFREYGTMHTERSAHSITLWRL